MIRPGASVVATGSRTRLGGSPPSGGVTMAGQEQVKPQRRDDGGPDDAPESAAAAAHGPDERDRRHPRRDRRGARVQRRGVRPRVRPEGWPVTAGPTAEGCPGRTSSRAPPRSPSSCPRRRPPSCRPGVPCPPGAAIDAPHGTTIVTLTYAARCRHGGGPQGDDGEPDRQPGHGEGLRHRRVQPRGHRRHGGARGRARAALPGRARALREDRGHPDVARGQGQPARLDDPGEPRHGDARARRWCRSSPATTSTPAQGRIFSYDVTGGCYEEHDHHSVGSGSLFARGALKKLYRRSGSAEDALRTAVEALYDAADDDSATGGPDVGRRIWPTVGLVDEGGARFVPDEEIAPVVDAIIASRVDNPGGAR